MSDAALWDPGPASLPDRIGRCRHRDHVELRPLRPPHSQNDATCRRCPSSSCSGGRLQGVVSSGSDAARVYVSCISANTGDYYCATNNNRPCGGLRGGPCKHLDALVVNAVAQYGAERTSRYLGLSEVESKRPSHHRIPRGIEGQGPHG